MKMEKISLVLSLRLLDSQSCRKLFELLKEEFGVSCNFEVDDAVQKLDKLRIVARKLGDYICRYGLCIRQCEATAESLPIKQSNIELEMANLGEHLQFRTTTGHDLRETLYYRLFGKLQVYKSRGHLSLASYCIEEDGAIYLDGGMMRGNGIVSVGSEEPYFLFPVVSPENVQRLKRIQELKLELKQMQDQIERD